MRTVPSVLLLLAAGCAATPPATTDRPPRWQTRFEHAIEFQTLVDRDLLVVGTRRHLYGLDPATGERLWRKRNVNAEGRDVIGVGDAPYVLVSDAGGGAFDDRDTHVLAVHRREGRILWESSALLGKVLQGTVDLRAGRLYAITVREPHGDDRGYLSGALPNKGLRSGLRRAPHVNALDIADGALVWTRAFDDEVLMRPSEPARGADARPFDLSLYHPPVIAADSVCVTYAGVRCYDAGTGRVRWSRALDVVRSKLALSYANPIVDDATLVVVGNRRVRAFDVPSGDALWRSERVDYVPEIFMDDALIYGQLGGRFYDLDEEAWEWHGGFGAFAIDKRTGKTRWRYAKAKDSVTNLLVLERRIWLADRNRLTALDRSSGEVVLRARHRFDDRPVYATLNGRGDVVLISETEAAAFDPTTGKRRWYTQHPRIGPGAWRRFSDYLLITSGTVLKIGAIAIASGGIAPSLSVPLGGLDVKVLNPNKVVADSAQRAGRRLADQGSAIGQSAGQANLAGRHQYFVTRAEGRDTVLLAGVDLETGATDRLLTLASSTPNVVIDEGNDSVYESSGNALVAVPLSAP